MANSLLQCAVDSLPCGGCRQHAIDYTTRNEVDFSTRERYHKYLWQFHNAVSTRIGNRPPISWEQYEREWLYWKPVDGLRIGFVAGCYEKFGGTETFHQTLVPRLPGVIGFVSLAEVKGDAKLLKVPVGSGEAMIASLVSQSDLIVSWSIDWQDRIRPKRLITVHHGSPNCIWDTGHALQGDSIVAVSEETATMLRGLTDRQVRHIPNAVDPSRLRTRDVKNKNGKKVCLWSHRWSADKRPELAIKIAEFLPFDWHMVLTGYRGEPVAPFDAQSDRVTILPPQHPGDWLAVADCFLSTSITEGFGLAVAEARLAGVPIVSTPVGIANQIGVAITLPIDASPIEWAKEIVSAPSHELQGLELFSLDAHIAAWKEVVRV